MERTAGLEWPAVLVPAPGALPPACDRKTWFDDKVLPERVLHVALCSKQETQPGLERALRELGHYVMVDWTSLEREHGPQAIGPEIIHAARDLRPTLVFMQIQRAGVVTPELVRALRLECAPSAVIVNWDGDQHHEPWDDERAWFVELGKEVDLSLVPNTTHPDDYKQLGVRYPGFLPCGYDEQIYRPVEPTTDVPPIVLLAQHYPHLRGYDHRAALVEALADRYGDRFAVYGNGWQDRPYGRPFLKQDQESPVYAAATIALSMSIAHDVSRCTSGRLFRALASGTCVAVEAFDDMEGFGLSPGVNCLVFSNFLQLCELIDRALAADWEGLVTIRGAAAEMAQALHCWPARVRELLAMVYAVRDDRRVR